MQRLFAMFPSGAPGFALLILRVSVALPLILDGFERRELLASGTIAAITLLAVSLVFGCLTPIAALLTIGIRFVAPLGLIVTDRSFEVVMVLSAVALLLLGPGAYSFDSLRFGRRVVKLPTDDDT